MVANVQKKRQNKGLLHGFVGVQDMKYEKESPLVFVCLSRGM